MIVTELLGNTREGFDIQDRHVEKVVLPSAQLVKRIQRVTSDHGTEIGIKLPKSAPDLLDGDVLYADERNVIVISVEPTDVIVIAPTSIREMGFVAHSLGNRHLQAQFFDAASEYGAEVMVVAWDHTVADFLTSNNVAFSRQERVLPVPFRHAEHTH